MLHIDFLATRIWISLWIFLISLLVVGLESIRVINYVTRFTEEIFATLIALCFLFDVAKTVVKYFLKDPVATAQNYCTFLTTNQPCFQDLSNASTCTNSTNSASELDTSSSPEPNLALVSVVMLSLTFFLAFTLKQLRRSTYLAGSVSLFQYFHHETFVLQGS